MIALEARPDATSPLTVSSVDTPRSSAAVLLDPTNPEWRRAAPARSHLRFETTRGVFVLELVRAWVPSAWKDQQIANDSPRSHNVRGTFAFAQFGPVDSKTRNTEIFLRDNPRSDAEPFTMLGTVIEGMDVLDSLYSGYGEKSGGGLRQGKQGPLLEGGNAYMDREYPKLDRILRVTVTTVER